MLVPLTSARYSCDLPISYRNVEAYVDDIVIKTKTQDQFIADLEETFNSL